MPIDFLDSADLESPVCFYIHPIRHDIMSAIVARVFDVANPASKDPATSGAILYLYRLPQHHSPVNYFLNGHYSQCHRMNNCLVVEKVSHYSFH